MNQEELKTYFIADAPLTIKLGPYLKLLLEDDGFTINGITTRCFAWRDISRFKAVGSNSKTSCAILFNIENMKKKLTLTRLFTGYDAAIRPMLLPLGDIYHVADILNRWRDRVADIR